MEADEPSEDGKKKCARSTNRGHGDQVKKNIEADCSKEESSPIKHERATGVPLDPLQEEILRAMPDDRAVSADELLRLEHPNSDILTALTVMELTGLVEKLPGAAYRKI